MTKEAATFLQDWKAFLHTMGPESRLRYAPTPSGYLHIGNAFNFILNDLSAASATPRADLLLRIDDLDGVRKRPEFIADIFDSLSWLGVTWNIGPRSPEDFEQNWSQSLRLHHYSEALEQLRASGLLFACAKSRRDLEPYGGQYPAAFRDQNLSLDDHDVAWRIKTPPDFPLSDFVVRRRDGVPAYQVASLVDDRLFGITHLIRGQDLEASTAAQGFLAQVLGWTELAERQVLHHPLFTDADGQKLSKSEGASALKSIYRSGRTSEAVYKTVGVFLGWEGGTREALLEKISIYRPDI